MGAVSERSNIDVVLCIISRVCSIFITYVMYKHTCNFASNEGDGHKSITSADF